MMDMVNIWLDVLFEWLFRGSPSLKAVVNKKSTQSAMNKVRSEGIGGA